MGRRAAPSSAGDGEAILPNAAECLGGSARGQILTGTAMDTHNTFDAPATIRPAPFAGSNAGGRITFDLPARSVAVVAIDP